MKRNNRKILLFLDHAPCHVVKWIDLSRKTVTEFTIQNRFRAADFVNTSSTSSSTIDIDAITELDSRSNSSLQQLDSLLAHLQMVGQQLTAAEFVDIDSSIPAFNEYDDDEHLKGLVKVSQEDRYLLIFVFFCIFFQIK